MSHAMAKFLGRPEEMAMMSEDFGDRIHQLPGVGLGVDIGGEIVDANRFFTLRLAAEPELFLFLLDLFLLLRE